MLSLLLAAASAAFRDLVGTFLVVAENRGKTWLAGTLDALGDLASIAVTVVGAGQVILHGFTGHTIAVLAVLLTVSFFGTALWTRLAQRIGAKENHQCPSPQPPKRTSMDTARRPHPRSEIERDAR